MSTTTAQPHAEALLRAARAAPSHAYLLHGPGGTGKRAAARALAADLLAEGAVDEASARARALGATHPDLTWVAPTGAHEMLVSDIEEPVVAASARTPFEADRRVFVLERVETLIEPAANRLLKTLEEPAPFVHLLLIADRLGEVLPTIVSRCQLVRFDPLPSARIEAALRDAGVAGEQARSCARLAHGDADRARELALGDGPDLRTAAERLARAVLTDRLEDRPWQDLLARAGRRGDTAAEEIEARLAGELEVTAQRDRRRRESEYADRVRRARRRAATAALDSGLSLVGEWLLDLARVAWGAQELIAHADRAGELAELAAGRDPQRLREAVELVADTRGRLALNVTEELACEALAFRLARVLGGAG
jgi:DNA polymerase-3 subunit delta'